MYTYVCLGWSESQPYLNNKKCVPTEDGAVFVPTEILEKKKSKETRAIEILLAFRNCEKQLKKFIKDNVPERGIKLTKQEINNEELRLDFCDHFTGEPGRLNVTHIYPGKVVGKDDYGNEIDRCSIDCDLTTEGVYEIANFLIGKRKKFKV